MSVDIPRSNEINALTEYIKDKKPKYLLEVYECRDGRMCVLAALNEEGERLSTVECLRLLTEMAR